MAYILERTFTRTDTSTPWPWSGMPADRQATLVSLRQTHGVTMTDSLSADGLVATYTDTAASESDYVAYFNAAQPHWQATDIEGNASTNNVVIDFTVTENT